MIFKKKHKTVYYTSLDDLPIWNWDRLHKTNDFRYICKEGLPNAEAMLVYKELMYSFDKLSLPLLRAKRDILVRVIDLVIPIIKESKDKQKIKNAGVILRAIALSGEHSDWLFEVNFTETSNQKQLLSLLAVAIKKSESIKPLVSDAEQTLNEKVVYIERALNVNIDIKSDSVNLFMEYQKQAVDLINKQKRG